MKTDLNKLFKIRTHNKDPHNGVTASFDQNVRFICSRIQESSVVLGCAPWFSNKKIFQALSNVPDGISIILDKSTVNKKIKSNSASWEDYSSQETSNFEFKALPVPISLLPTDFEYTPLGDCGVNRCSFRVVGRNQAAQKKGKTLFHYKFLVLCSVQKSGNQIKKVNPESVICGSFNFSENAEQSREALLHIENSGIAEEFYDEWARAFLLSENIERSSTELNPEYLPASTEEEVFRLLLQDESYRMLAEADDLRHEQEAVMIEKAASPYW